MKTIYFVLAWFGVMLGLSLAGTFDVTDGRPPLPLLLAVIIPVLIYVLDRRLLKGAVFGGIQAMSQSSVIFLQVDRIIGGAFLVEYAKGNLPSGFALPAGLGDVAIGLAAPWVANNLLTGKTHAIKTARVWNYLGIFDLVLALTMGVTHATSPLGIFAQDVSMHPISQYPLSLIPTWAVPLAIILHLRSLQSLREPRI